MAAVAAMVQKLDVVVGFVGAASAGLLVYDRVMVVDFFSTTGVFQYISDVVAAVAAAAAPIIITSPSF
jgi:hypothetical protein